MHVGQTGTVAAPAAAGCWHWRPTHAELYLELELHEICLAAATASADSVAPAQSMCMVTGDTAHTAELRMALCAPCRVLCGRDPSTFPLLQLTSPGCSGGKFHAWVNRAA